MKNEEVIKQLNWLIKVANKREEVRLYHIDAIVFETAIKAIKKQTPTKPNYTYDDEPLCPYCQNVLDYGDCICMVCNQLIDWSDKK